MLYSGHSTMTYSQQQHLHIPTYEIVKEQTQ